VYTCFFKKTLLEMVIINTWKDYDGLSVNLSPDHITKYYKQWVLMVNVNYEML
jgi:hypothetical protein